MIEEWLIKEPEGKAKHCILSLPGRANGTSLMVNIGEDMRLPNTLVASVRTRTYSWYPMPVSATDQQEAVMGLPAARGALWGVLKRIERAWGISSKNIAIIGFSAGAVMSVEVAVHGQEPYAGVVCFAGTVLEPDKVPPKNEKNDTPIMLVHYEQDACFDWDERYVPMREALISKGYRVQRRENSDGGHTISRDDVMAGAHFLAKQFGYSDWVHPEYYRFWFQGNDDADDEGGGGGDE